MHLICSLAIFYILSIQQLQGLKNRRCAMCRTDFPIEFLERPELLMPIDANASTSNTDQNEYQWFYKGRNGWWQYDERTCQEIEDAYKNGDKHCTILVAGYVYVVDFEQMLQQRQTDPSRKRQVKRDLATIPKKGVAGLRLTNALASSSTPLDEHDYADENSNSNIIATIAAAEAAIRIASDIIDSTLAHADEYQTQEDPSPVTTTLINAHMISTGVGAEASVSGDNNEHGISTSPSTSYASTSLNGYNRRELLDEIEETLNISNPSSINNSFGTTSTNLDDFFKMTLNDFKNLTMNNIADDSSDDNNDDDDDDNFGEQSSSRH